MTERPAGGVAPELRVRGHQERRHILGADGLADDLNDLREPGELGGSLGIGKRTPPLPA